MLIIGSSVHSDDSQKGSRIDVCFARGWEILMGHADMRSGTGECGICGVDHCLFGTQIIVYERDLPPTRLFPQLIS